MRKGKRFWLPVVILFFLALACSMPGSISTEDRVRTQIALTQASLPTIFPITVEAATANPTSTVESTATQTATITSTATIAIIPSFTKPAEVIPSDTPTSCDVATHVADVTVPDGTEFTAGTSFEKTWRLKNVGSCTWTTDYEAVFIDGDHMNGPNDINLTKNVAPGETIDITVSLKAPNSPGTYRGNWKLRNTGGQIFGLTSGGPFFVIIKVK